MSLPRACQARYSLQLTIPIIILKRNQPIIITTAVALLCAHRYEQCILQPAVYVLCRNKTFLSDYYDNNYYDVLKLGVVIKRYT